MAAARRPACRRSTSTSSPAGSAWALSCESAGPRQRQTTMSAGRPKQRSKARKQGSAKAAPERSAQTLAERGADGRWHLALITDPASGRERLELVRPVFVEDWQNRLAAAAANTAYAMLRVRRSVVGAAELGKAAMDSTSTLVGGLLARAPAGTIACQSGCDHCCHQSVGITPTEALAIYAFLLETRGAEELKALRARVRDFCERTRGLSSRERVSPELPCPFLAEHACSIYAVRPLSCRGMNSLDADVCARKLHDAETREAAFEGKLPGHVLVEPIRAFHAISAGLQLALSERFGLDMRPLDLALALELLLEQTPELDGPLTRSWLSGAPALAKARGGDASQDAGRVGLAR